MSLTELELATALFYGKNFAEMTVYDDDETSVVCFDDKGSRNVYWWDEEEGENYLIATYDPEREEIVLYNEEVRPDGFDGAIHNIASATGNLRVSERKDR